MLFNTHSVLLRGLADVFTNSVTYSDGWQFGSCSWLLEPSRVQVCFKKYWSSTSYSTHTVEVLVPDENISLAKLSQDVMNEAMQLTLRVAMAGQDMAPVDE